MYHPCREHRGCRAQRARRRHNHRAVRRVSEDTLPLFWKSLEKLFSSNTTLLLVRGQHLDGAPTPPPKHHPSSNGIFYFCRNVATFLYFCIGPHLACQAKAVKTRGWSKKRNRPRKQNTPKMSVAARRAARCYGSMRPRPLSTTPQMNSAVDALVANALETETHFISAEKLTYGLPSLLPWRISMERSPRAPCLAAFRDVHVREQRIDAP